MLVIRMSGVSHEARAICLLFENLLPVASYSVSDLEVPTVPSLTRILTKQHDIRSGGEYLLKTPENAISETLNFKMSLDATALKNLCLGASCKAAYSP